MSETGMGGRDRGKRRASAGPGGPVDGEPPGPACARPRESRRPGRGGGAADGAGWDGLPGGPRAPERLSAIPTRWTELRGPKRDVLGYVYRVYFRALAAYLRVRLRRGDFPPLREQDAEDLLHDLFLVLDAGDWPAKLDPAKGRFRPFLVGRLVFYLRDRARTARGRAARLPTDDISDPDLTPDPEDPAEQRLALDWARATVASCLERIRAKNLDWHTALEADLRRSGGTDAAIAATLGWSLTRYRSTLKRARAEFRRICPRE